MPSLPRKTQLVFGQNLVPNGNVAKFGSLAGGAADYSNDPALIQTTQWLNGLAGALIGNRSPALEDLNGLFLVMTQQLAYLLQNGIPEWDSNTTYWKYQICRIPGTPYIASSRTDNNSNNSPATDSNNWTTSAITAPVQATSVGTQTISVDGLFHAVSFAAEGLDPMGCYDPSTSRFTAPISGAYFFACALQCDNNGAPAGGTDMTVAVVDVGSNAILRGSSWSVANPVGSRWEPRLSSMVVLTSGQVVEIRLEANSTPNSGSLNVSNSDLSIFRLP